MPSSRLTFKIASDPEEFEQIHRLNYRTFVEEIPQHPAHPDRRLIDKFHDQNIYHICLDNKRLVGMLATRGTRPFSLDAKMEDLDRWLPKGLIPCEFRLLAIVPEFRKTSLLARLLHFAALYCMKQGYTLAIASGTLLQARLYKRMGFTPFSSPVGSNRAMYQPMYISLETAISLFKRINMETPDLPVKANFLPGPIAVSSSVLKAFRAAPVSHRSEKFLRLVSDTEHLLCSLTGASYVAMFLGSGTLANDVIGAQLKLLSSPGLILTNGEFGDRLLHHARHLGLVFDVLKTDWGNSYNMQEIERHLERNKHTAWLWTTHCETSTGIINDLQMLVDISRRQSVKLCLDCISSLGTIPLDLSDVYLSSSTSGKGLASLPGIALVFYNKKIASSPQVPRYLDLGYYREKRGVPFTQSSNLVRALHQALLEREPPEHYKLLKYRHNLLRTMLAECGISVMVPEHHAAPAILSIQLPPKVSSKEVGDAMDQAGYLLSYRSDYLFRHNILQISIMGEHSDQQCRGLIDTLSKLTQANDSNVLSLG